MQVRLSPGDSCLEIEAMMMGEAMGRWGAGLQNKMKTQHA